MKCVPGLQTFFDPSGHGMLLFVEVLGVLAPQNLRFKTVRPGPSPSGDASTAESTVARYK